MKTIFLCALSACSLLFCACHSADAGKDQSSKKDDAYAIIGKITGQDTGTIYLYHDRPGVRDSAKLDHGFFTFKGRIDSVEFCQMGIYKAGDPNNLKGFFLENGKISMLIKKDSLDYAIISGTPTQDEFNRFHDGDDKPYRDSLSAIMKQYIAAMDKKDRRAMDSLDHVYDREDSVRKNFIAEYTSTHPASIVAAYEVFQNFRYNPDAKRVAKLYGMLNDSIRSTHYGRQLGEVVKHAQATDFGQTAPDFSVPDAGGKPISLSSFRGKYVLLDFWASWCGPCRRENPALVKAYQRFHDKGFDIFSVSIDESKKDWLAAVKKDGLTWTQASDLKGWKTQATTLYGIQGIPMNFLLDKEGKIIGKELRGENLIGKLQEIFP